MSSMGGTRRKEPIDFDNNITILASSHQTEEREDGTKILSNPNEWTH
jgi:hypothetical protein